MYKNKQSPAFSWLSKPDPNHIVQFYTKESLLLRCLAKYISSGIQAGDACIVIATEAHVQKLDKRLARSVDVTAAKKQGLYHTFDASQTLEKFMVDDMPDEELFNKSIGKLLDQIAATGKPIRAYGEMVALLWQVGNGRAVMQLEELWNKLAEEYSFALYCAYPDLHFIMHPEVRQAIYHRHHVLTPSFAV